MRLLRVRSIEEPARLLLPCRDRDEFAARLTGLADLFKLFDVADSLLPQNRQGIGKAETLKRIQAVLDSRLAEEGEKAQAVAAIRTLRAINGARAAYQHSSAGSELPKVLPQIGISYPVQDYAEAWAVVRSSAAEALTAIRKALQSLTPD